jgi:hypothetical protein
LKQHADPDAAGVIERAEERVMRHLADQANGAATNGGTIDEKTETLDDRQKTR